MPRVRRRTTADEILISAQYCPGFEEDLTSWEVLITNTGVLYQTLDPMLPRKQQERMAVVPIDDAHIITWMIQIDTLDFALLAEVDARRCIDDAGIYTFCLPYKTPPLSLTLRALDYCVLEGNAPMHAFRVLWENIHAFAPFEQTRRPWLTAKGTT